MFKNPHKIFKSNMVVTPKLKTNFHKVGLNLDALDDHARAVGTRAIKAHYRSKGTLATHNRLKAYGLHDDFNHMMRVGQTIALAAGRMKLH